MEENNEKQTGKKKNMKSNRKKINDTNSQFQKKTHKINFGDLSSCVSKLLLIKQSEGTIDNNILKNHDQTPIAMEVEA